MPSIGESSCVMQTKSLEMRKAEERLLTLHRWGEGEGELDQFGELDALEVDTISAIRGGSR